MEDVLVKATAGDARIYAVTTTHLTQHMNEIHHPTPPPPPPAPPAGAGPPPPPGPCCWPPP